MTHMNNNMMHPQQPSFYGAMSPAGSMFQPGFAGTNVQEVQHWNNGGSAQSFGTQTPAFSGGMSGGQSIFAPGFANTNVQEVRQLNNTFPAQQQQQQQQSFGQNQALQYMQNQQAQNQQASYFQQQPTYQQAFGQGVNSIFSPNFAGTNTQEVQARNQVGYGGQTGYMYQSANPPAMSGSIFSPGFAGTNVQEVRQLNQPGFNMQAGQIQQQQQQQQQFQPQAFANQPGTGAQSIFSPGFAGTNAQEVRQLNTPGQMGPHTGSIFPGSL